METRAANGESEGKFCLTNPLPNFFGFLKKLYNNPYFLRIQKKKTFKTKTDIIIACI